jgi:protein-tyrosine phosphatase
MIDLHCHIIPGVDDGPEDFDEALRMLQIAEADGIKTMVATPHLFSELSRFKDFKSLGREFQKLKRLAKKEGIKIEILRGAENFFETNIREKLANRPHLLTLNKSSYFLLEFPHDLVFPGTREFIFNVMNDGLIPIICHPERNEVFQENVVLLYRFLQQGALCQLNAGSIRGDFGPTSRNIAIKLLRLNMVHTIASDCHNTNMRKPVLSFMYRELAFLEEEKIDSLLIQNPRAIINNEVLPDTGPMKDPKGKTSFFGFIRSILD